MHSYPGCCCCSSSRSVGLENEGCQKKAEEEPSGEAFYPSEAHPAVHVPSAAHVLCCMLRLAASICHALMDCALHDAPCSLPQIGVIPARYQSVRFPGKPLVKILGVPMVVRTWQQACLCKTLSKVIVATDDERIAEACSQEGAEVVMTSVSCANGAHPVHDGVMLGETPRAGQPL